MRRLGIRVLAPLLVGLAGLVGAWFVARSCRPPVPARPTRGSESAEVEAMPHLQGRSPSGEAAREADPPPEASVEKARIVGRVLLPDGDPAVGVKVWTAELHGEWGAAVTDADGRFVLERSAGVTPPIVATAPQSGYGVAPGPYLRGGETRDVGTIQLAPGSVIEGQVVDEDGLPHAEASVSLWTEAQPVPAGWSGMWRADKAWSGHETDAEGRFAFSRLPPGSYWVRAHVHAGVGGDRILEHVAAGTTDLRFVIPRPREDAGLSVRVVAVGPDGTAIPRFDADLTEHAWSTGAIGTAEEPAELWLDEGRPPFRILVYGACDEGGASLGYAPVLLEDVASREEPYVVRMETPGARGLRAHRVGRTSARLERQRIRPVGGGRSLRGRSGPRPTDPAGLQGRGYE